VAIVGLGLAFLLVPVVFGNLSPEARKICMGIIIVIVIYMPFWALLNSIWGITRAGGDTFTGMIADLSVNVTLFVPLCFILALCTNMGPFYMYFCVKLTDVVKYFIARHFMRKEKWVRNMAV
jgi:Na+-driven multidrug efflux pump